MLMDIDGWIEREREEERGAQCIMGVPQQSKPIAA